MGPNDFPGLGQEIQYLYMKKSSIASTQEVERWWDENPFTLGVATNDYENNDLVGRIPFEKMDKNYFNKIESKFHKHHGSVAQYANKPLLSNLIDFDFIKGKKVLDIAIGSGLHTVTFAKAGAIVTGIDLTQYAVMQTKKNLEVNNLDNVEILQMDAQNMSFKNNTFSLVNAWGCLMHMPDTEKAINEIYRVLKPGGQVLAYMYNRDSWPFWFNIFLLRGILLGGLIRYRGDVDRLTSRYSDGSHKNGNMLTKFFTKKEIRDTFKRNGFKSVEVFPLQIEHEPDHWPMRSFPIFKFLPKRVKSWMSYRWGYGLIIKAKK